MRIRAGYGHRVIAARKSSSRLPSSKKYVFMFSVNIFFRFYAHTRISGHSATIVCLTIQQRRFIGRALSRHLVSTKSHALPFSRLGFRAFSQLFASIDRLCLALPIGGVARRVRSTVNAARGKVELAGHVSRERNIAARSNGRGSVNRD